MKLRNILRMQAVLVAFAAVMMMGTTAAAQEIENTVWADGPNVVPFAQPAPANLVMVTNTENATTTDGLELNVAAMIQPNITPDAGASQWTSVEVWAMISSLVFIAVIMMYSLVEAKRNNKKFNTRVNQAKSWTALS
jgi:hypothetical protein